MLLAGKVALVTGAGGGLGRAHALALAAAGAKVTVNDLGSSGAGEGRDASRAEAVAAEIAAAGGEAMADCSNVAEWDSAEQMVDDTVKRFGGLDILVNNAGISRAGVFGALTERDWDLQSAVNVKGTVALINAATKLWSSQPPAPRAIVNTSSPAGPHPVSPIGLYSATKAAVIAITLVAAQELAALGVRVNAIAPIARTRLVEEAPELMAMMAPDADFDSFAPGHVSQLIVYLSSELCRFTGRLFGGHGDEIFLLREWSAQHTAKNMRVPWSPESLDAALSGFPLQEERWILFPGGSRFERSPSDETMSALQAALAVP